MPELSPYSIAKAIARREQMMEAEEHEPAEVKKVDLTEQNNAKYLKNSSTKKPEKLGNIRI
jgi:hypothetical protein